MDFGGTEPSVNLTDGIETSNGMSSGRFDLLQAHQADHMKSMHLPNHVGSDGQTSTVKYGGQIYSGQFVRPWDIDPVAPAP